MAAMVVKSFFEGIKDSMLEELNGPTRRAAMPDGTVPEDEEDIAEPVEPGEVAAAEEAARREAEEEKRRLEAEKRRAPSGWSDGRSRN